jgi:hypothetical protein
MREIKFRAWDKQASNWSNVPIGVHQFNNTLSFTTPARDLIFMQYTGLKDRNGKEIYEGDIVRAFAEHSPNAFRPKVVAWTSGKQYNGWNVARGPRFTVLGNIYENPELMK